MEFVFEFLLQIVGEILLQVVFEALANLGFQTLAEPFRKRQHPVIGALGCALWGAIAGGVSLLILPKSPIPSMELRTLNLVVTPFIVAFIFMSLGRRKVRRGKDVGRLDQFRYAYVFAAAMAAVRYFGVG